MTAADKQSSSRFSRNKLGKKTGGLLVLGFISVMLVSVGISQSSGTPTVSIGENGIQVNGGGLDMGGTDISDGGTVIWDASEGFIPESAVNVSQVDLSTAAGSFLTWDSNNEVFDVDAGSIQSGTTASDVGLGSVLNKEQLAIDGSNGMQAGLDMNGNTISEVNQVGYTDTDAGFSNFIDFNGFDNDMTISTDGSGDAISIRPSGPLEVEASGNANIDSSDGTVILTADTASSSGGPYECSIDTANGDWICDGSKSWAHDLGNGSEAVYTSQESPEVRAVYEGKVEVDSRTRVELPSHYSKTVSDSEPKLRATATVQGQLAYSAVIEKTDDYLVLDSSEPATVNYRVTGVREGYEDKNVVREK